MKNERKLTCIVCPKGCDLTVHLDENGKVENINGYTCPRGKDYALSECTFPTRTVTTTVRCEDGGIVSVKTNKPIPKKMIFEIMTAINSINVNNSVHIGDIIIENVCGTGANVVATMEKTK